MIVIQRQIELGADRILHLQLPEDVPVGPIEVLVVCESSGRSLAPEEQRLAAGADRETSKPPSPTDEVGTLSHSDRPQGEAGSRVPGGIRPRPTSPEERRAAFEAGRGLLQGVGPSLEEFLAERREDDARRDRALGL
jgi:hypothetical protein